MRRSSSGSSAPAARSDNGCSRPPTGFGARSAATRSATSSRATSSTRTSATSAAASAPFRKGSWLRTCAVRRTSCRTRRSFAAPGRRGSGARPRSASRAGSTRPSPASTTRRSSTRSGPSCPSCTSTRSRRSRSGRARRRSASTSAAYLELLRSLGLGSLPGTAAEILDDEVRAVICPDKVSTEQWLAVHDAAHRVGLRSNVTIMFGHVERPEHWARHLLRAREQQHASRAASPSSSRCRSCTWRRRCGCKGAPGRGRRSASHCCCTRSRGWRCTRRSRTSRRRGSSSARRASRPRSERESTTSAGR